MSQTPGLPNGSSDAKRSTDLRGPAPIPPLPDFDGGTAEEPRRGVIDFNYYTKVEPGAGKPAKATDPASAEPVISWAELLRQTSRSEDEVSLGSLPELQIDAVSDNDIIKHLERESGRSGILHQIAGGSSKRLRGDAGPKSGKRLNTPPLEETPPPPPTSKAPVADQAAPRPEPEKEWYRDLRTEDGSAVDLMTAAKDALNPLLDPNNQDTGDEADVLAAALQCEDGTSAVNLGLEPQASALLSSVGLLPTNLRPRIIPPPATPLPAPRSSRPASKPNLHLKSPRPLKSWLGGAAIGVAGAALVGIGLWAGGVVSFGSNPPVVVGTVQATEPAETVTPEQARRLLESGEPEQALAAFIRCDDSPLVLSGRGQARWLSYIRRQKQQKAPLVEADAEVTTARKELIDSKTAEGSLWLGLINEAFGQIDSAREAYQLGRDNYPDRQRLFSAALSRLDARTSTQPVALKVDPQLGLALSLMMTELSIDDEAGYDYWEAMAQARRGDFSAARQTLLKARAAHDARRDLIVRRGQNPDSDPREEIFLHSCDQLLAYWDVQAKLHAAGFAAEGRSPAQVVDTLLANQKKYDAAMKLLTSTLNTSRLEDVPAALDSLAKQREQAEANLKRAIEEARRAEEALQVSQHELTQRDKQLAEVRANAEKELKRALAREAEVRQALEQAVAARRGADESFSTVRDRLVKARLVNDQAGPADIVKALDSLLSIDVAAKDAELARLRALLEEARKAPNLPAPAPEPANPARAEPLLGDGMQLYYARRYAEAEEALLASLRHNSNDARTLYFLGLARMYLGKSAAAHADLTRAAELERRGQPASHDIALLLERIQGYDRQVINRYRR